MTKHTPGPWIVCGTYQPAIVAYDDSVVANCPQNNGCHEANARLIAAAPDLLDVLMEFLTDQETMNPPYRNEAICERARAAIAKTSA
jgi:hypothetical protein